jgi:hypothetical protein
MNIKDSILLNVEPKEKILEEESVEVKEIDYVARALNSISNLVREMTYIKSDIDNCHKPLVTPYANMITKTKAMSDEDYSLLLEKIKNFYLKKIDLIKDSVYDIFEDKDKEEDKEKKEEEHPEMAQAEIQVYKGDF